MDYEIVISSNVSEELINAVSRYWLFRDGHFVHNLNTINEKTINKKELINRITKHSHGLIHFPNCKLCFSEFEILVKDRKEFITKVNDQELVCNLCKSFSPKYQEGIPLHFPIEISINQLSEIEYKILCGIVKLKSKRLIYRHIFNNDLENHEIWKVINTLQKKGLIWIERDNSWRIKSFGFKTEILKLIN
ncbi:hypothetical protein [Aquimarina algiphila]|uniref:hypothetical protein n=1 Tax=Aquimarina algiphila TaxID=2047982 RepID=UPI00248FB2DF|nr:hypothetical protein [Aquimarina algiphila]